ncbi:hypothetical protein K1719_037042 [Acacia pycnantha]|nr:hypothetical protein K1719_037042 [Acacia pycnantha]
MALNPPIQHFYIWTFHSLGWAGGLLAAWKSSLIEVEVLNLDRQLIHLRCRFTNDWWFCVTAVYAIPDQNHKQVLWSSLSNLAATMLFLQRANMAMVLGKKCSELVPISTEEDDLINRSSKKLKNDCGERMEEEWPKLGISEKSQKEGRTFADILQGINHAGREDGIMEEQKALTRGGLSDDTLSESEEEDSEPLCVITEDHCKTGNKSEHATSQQDRSEGMGSAGASNYGEIRSSDSDVWRVVQKPRRRRKESNSRRTVNPSSTSGSRFGVLDVEEEREATGKEEKQMVTVGGSLEMTGVAKGKQGRKEIDGDNGLGVHRVEKRNRVYIQSEKQGEISVEKRLGQGGINGDETCHMSEQDMGDNDQLGSPKLVRADPSFSRPSVSTDPLQLEASQVNDLLDPGEDGPRGEYGPTKPLMGKFWSGNEFMDAECSLVAESDEEIMHPECGPQEQECGPQQKEIRGLLAAWKSSLIEVEVLNLDRQLIHLRCRFTNDCWFCVTTVYAIPDQNHKQVLWSSLSNLAVTMAYPWTVIGDFNDIACPEERTGGLGRNEPRFSLFSDRMRNCNLMDLGAVGPKFTWKGPKVNNGRRL